MTRCTTCNDTGKVTEPDERPVDAPASWHGHWMELVRVEVECEDCPRCDACSQRLAVADDAYYPTLRTDESLMLNIEVCGLGCLDELLGLQPGVTRLIILGSVLQWWSIQPQYEDPDLTWCLARRVNIESERLLKELSE